MAKKSDYIAEEAATHQQQIQTDMGIKYKVHSTPQPAGRKKEALSHARAVSRGTVKMNDLCEIICQRGSISSADVKAVLDSFVWAIGHSLKFGDHVELEELGHFSPSLRTRELPDGKMGVIVDSVNFRCSKKLKETLSMAELERVKTPEKSSLNERKKRLFCYLERNEHITTRGYSTLNECSRYQAQKDLKQFVADKEIYQLGGGTHVMFVLPDTDENN